MSKFKSIGSKVKSIRNSMTGQSSQERLDQDGADKYWLDLRFHDTNEQSIKKPKDLEDEMGSPEGSIDGQILDRVQGSMVGMALGDALGAHVEFRPRQYMCENPVTGLEGGGTWGLQKGQFTDDTSMALCLANSLVVHSKFNLYDQLVRYKWWYRKGYMSSTGECFDIGAATSQSIDEFEHRQKKFSKKHKIPDQEIDYLSDEKLLDQFNKYCSEAEVAGNGALMRLAPVPLFFYRHPAYAVEYSGRSGQITHGDTKAYDACRYYGALIVAAVRGENKNDILDKNFYLKHKDWFGGKPLCNEIMTIAEGSFKRKGGYDEGIRGKGYIVNALEAALWAFWDDGDSFKTGALKAVNLGDDTDTTAAIYGQLAGAYYGFKKLPEKWVKCVYARDFILNLSKWITYEGCKWEPSEQITPYNPLSPSKRRSSDKTALLSQSGLSSNTQDLIDEEPVSPIIVTKKASVGVDENKAIAKRLARTESVHPQNPQGSTVPAVTNGGTANQNTTHLSITSQSQPTNINGHASLKVLNSNKQSSTIQTSTFSSNSSKYYETAPDGSYQHGTGLDHNQMAPIVVASIPSPTATVSRHLTIPDNKQVLIASQTISHSTKDNDVSKNRTSKDETSRKSAAPTSPRKTDSFNIPSTSQENLDSKRGFWTRIRQRARSKARPLDGQDESIDFDDVNSPSPSTNNKNRPQFPTGQGSSDKRSANQPSPSQQTDRSANNAAPDTKADKKKHRGRSSKP